jgi:mono/diheme cytochrome c family protein
MLRMGRMGREDDGHVGPSRVSLGPSPLEPTRGALTRGIEPDVLDGDDGRADRPEAALMEAPDVSRGADDDDPQTGHAITAQSCPTCHPWPRKIASGTRRPVSGLT